MSTRFLVRASAVLAGAVAYVSLICVAARGDEPASQATSKRPHAARPPVSGQELFTHEWKAGDELARGGDGLGPVFNERSCVACHNQGDVGGGGGVDKNVESITAVSYADRKTTNGTTHVRSDESPTRRKKRAADQQRELANIHPALTAARSMIFHRQGVTNDYDGWRKNTLGFLGPGNPNGRFLGAAEIKLGRLANLDPVSAEALSVSEYTDRVLSAARNVGGVAVATENYMFVFTRTERNTPAVFGAGLIDEIPDEVLVQAAAKRYEGFPSVTGRVSRLADNRLGRFGWKSQTASLKDFVLTACAVELGLEVSGHGQAAAPYQARAWT
jgi:hypothetical protein